MGMTRTVLGAAVAVAIGAVALADGRLTPRPDAGVVTREWTWATEAGVVTFTASGPAAEVDAFDPRDRGPSCKGCILESSIVPLADDAILVDGLK